MATLDTRPGVVDLLTYGGDTFTLTITAPEEITDGMVWAAQIRTTQGSDTVDAEFTITPPAVSGGPAFLTLDSETTSALVVGAPVIVRRVGRAVLSVAQYVGVWDCQVSADGDDPVRTLVQGTLTVELDVTRVVP